jgi:hypothetical protein
VAAAAAAALLSTGLALSPAAAGAAVHGRPSAHGEQPGFLITYSSQGTSGICLRVASGDGNFAATAAPGGGNCRRKDIALSDTHLTGMNTLWSGPNATGLETCVTHGSYYQELETIYYPGTGISMYDNIDSTYWKQTAICHP